MNTFIYDIYFFGGLCDKARPKTRLGQRPGAGLRTEARARARARARAPKYGQGQD